MNPDFAVGLDAEARSKPFLAKPIDSASDGTSISGACALPKTLKTIGSEKGENDFETACLGYLRYFRQARPSLSP